MTEERKRESGRAEYFLGEKEKCQTDEVG